MVKIKFNTRPVPRESLRTKVNKDGKLVRFDPQSKMMMELRASTILQLPNGYVTIKKNESVETKIYCGFSIPKSWPKEKQKEAMLGNIKYIKPPDCDNIAKLYLDAIKGIVFYDDSQVSTLSIHKFYTTEKPYVLLEIRRNENG